MCVCVYVFLPSEGSLCLLILHQNVTFKQCRASRGGPRPCFFLSSDKHKMAGPTPVSLHKPVKHPLPLALCTGTPAPGRTARTAFLLICQGSVHAVYLCCINHSFIAYPPSPFSGRHVFFFPGWCR